MRQIPAKFHLFGHQIEVRLVPDLADSKNVLGLCWPHRGLIELQEPNEDYSFPTILQTFWHEVIHMTFWHISEGKHYNNEKLVDLVSQCVLQVLKSKRGRALIEGVERGVESTPPKKTKTS